MTDKPPAARLCRACASRFTPLDQPRCSACDPTQRTTGPKRPKPKPGPKTSSRLEVLDLAALPEPTLEDLAAYLAAAPEGQP